MTEHSTATVETLTAEVRTLMVGSRQVTLSVARQLDVVPPTHLEPFGRVSLDLYKRLQAYTEGTLIGRHRRSGALCLSWIDCPRLRHRHHYPVGIEGDGEYAEAVAAYEVERAAYEEAKRLPLIVLAGLK